MFKTLHYVCSCLVGNFHGVYGFHDVKITKWLRHNWANSISLVEEKLFCFSVSLCIRLVMFPKDKLDFSFVLYWKWPFDHNKREYFFFLRSNISLKSFKTDVHYYSHCSGFCVWANDPVAWRIFLVFIHLKLYMCWRQQFGFSGNTYLPSKELLLTVHTYCN